MSEETRLGQSLRLDSCAEKLSFRTSSSVVSQPDKRAGKTLLARLRAVMRTSPWADQVDTSIARYDPLKNLVAFVEYERLWTLGLPQAASLLRRLGIPTTVARQLWDSKNILTREDHAVLVEHELVLHAPVARDCNVCSCGKSARTCRCHEKLALNEPGLYQFEEAGKSNWTCGVVRHAKHNGCAAPPDISALRRVLRRCFRERPSSEDVAGVVRLSMPAYPGIESVGAFCQFVAALPKVRLEVAAG